MYIYKLYYVILNSITLNYVMLYYIVLYYIILYYIKLYTILSYIIVYIYHFNGGFVLASHNWLEGESSLHLHPCSFRHVQDCRGALKEKLSANEKIDLRCQLW